MKSPARSWSKWEHKLLRAMYADEPVERIAAVLQRSASSVKSRATLLHLSKGTRRVWTRQEEQLLRKLWPNNPTKNVARRLRRSICSVQGRAGNLGLSKSPDYIEKTLKACGYQVGKFGIGNRFAKGHTPSNKGLRRPGWFAGRMRETQFKKGQKPHGWKPIGSLRVNADGYLERKLTDTGYPPRDWRPLHRLMWEEAHGPIPPGHIVVFKDRDRTHVTLDNLECISMTENARRNRMWTRLPRELAEVIQLNGVLKRKLRRKEREEHNDGSAQPSLRDDRSA